MARVRFETEPGKICVYCDNPADRRLFSQKYLTPDRDWQICNPCDQDLIRGFTMARTTWTTLENKQVKIASMDLGHLSNTIRMLGANLEKARASNDRQAIDRIEADLFALQCEFDSRDTEISQLQGIARALGLK